MLTFVVSMNTNVLIEIGLSRRVDPQNLSMDHSQPLILFHHFPTKMNTNYFALIMKVYDLLSMTNISRFQNYYNTINTIY